MQKNNRKNEGNSRSQCKKRSKVRALSLMLAAALTVPLVAYGSIQVETVEAMDRVSGLDRFTEFISYNKSYEEKLKEAQENKKKLEEDRKAIIEENARLEELKSDILNYIQELDMQLNELTLHIEELEASILAAQEELKVTQADLVIARETEANQYETMKKRIQYLYENGSEDILDAFLSSGSIVDFLNQVEYAKKISEYDSNLLQRYKETKETIIKQEAYLESKLEELTMLEENALFEQETLLKLSAQKGEEILKYTEAIGVNEELFAEYSEEITAENANIENIEEEERKGIEEEERKRKEEEERQRKLEEERKKKLEEERKNAASSITKTDNTSISDMIWPLPGDGRVYSKFGYRIAPKKGASTYHQGWDIGGEMGASIVATLAGTVTKATYSVSGGNYVEIDHGDGVATRYLHCSKLLVSVGDYVKQGEVIAKVGSTGISTGPHLHYSIVINGTYVDPEKYIRYNE